MNGSPAVYRPRNPKATGWYRCVEDYFEEFVRVYDDRFAKRFGFWRPHIEKVIHRFLDCGDLHNGFARVKCGDCGHEFLAAFSCKGRRFCPSCHQKRVVEFGEFLCMPVLAKVSHRHIVFSLPKIIRRNFLYERKLLGKMSRCAWERLEFFLKASCPGNSVPEAVVATQTFGDFLSFHPHLHIRDSSKKSTRETLCFVRIAVGPCASLPLSRKKPLLRILKHLGLWVIPSRPPLRKVASRA